MLMKTKPKFTYIKNIGWVCWSILGVLIIIAVIFYIFYLIRLAMIPLVLAFAIAYLLTPLVRLLQKKIKKKIYAVSIAYLIFLAIIAIAFFFIIPMIAGQFEIFIENLPLYIENLTEMVNRFLAESQLVRNIEQFTGVDMPEDIGVITEYFMNTTNGLDIFQQITDFFRNIINIIITLVIGPIFGFFVLKDTHRLRKLFMKVIPQRAEPHAKAIMDRINMVASRYIRGQLLASIIVGVMAIIGLYALGIDFAFLLGFIAGALNLIPFMGPVLGVFPAAITAFFISPLRALFVVLLFIVIQQIDSFVTFPIIMKHQVRLHPGIIIFSLIAGGALFGFLGLLLAVPVVAMIQEILKYYLIDKKNESS